MTSREHTSPLALSRTSLLLRYASIAVILALVAGAFAYTAGWLATPAPFKRLTTTEIVNRFEANAGPHPGFRRNHAKGICVSGTLVSDGTASGLSRASVFRAGTYPVVGRFSIPGGNPSQDDASSDVRSFAMRIRLPGGEEWRTAMNSVPVFMVRTPQALYEEMGAMRPDAQTHRPNPQRKLAFEQMHPEMQTFRNWVNTHPPSSSFHNATYYSVNAFRMTDAQGTTRFVRWSVVPDSTYKPMSLSQADDPDFLASELVNRLAQGPTRWHLIVTVAQPGDAVDDATRLWPDARETVDAGTLTIDKAQAQISGPCRDINYDPLILPDGIEASADPLLAARSGTYAVSFARRVNEEARGAGSSR
jgi:catalase